MRLLALALTLAALAPRASAQSGPDGPPAVPPPAATPAAGSDGPPAPPPGGAALSPAAPASPWPVSPWGVQMPFIPAIPVPGAERTLPSVVIMTPASGAFLSRTTAVSANATDNVGVASVQFLLDGWPLGAPLTSAPFTFQWDSLVAPDGPHTLAAVVVDVSGNSATSPIVALNVDNAPPGMSELSATAVAPRTAVVRWKTSERADARVEYGTTTAYGLSTKVNASLEIEHGASLAQLVPGAEYHFRAISRDPAGNLAASEDGVFVASGSTAAAFAVAAASDDASARAPQSMLSPARADGINDKAIFGPEAKEVSIFDIRGRRVFHAVSPSPAAPVSWDCRDGAGRVLESGVYLATIVKRDGGRVNQSFSIAK